MNEDEAKGAWAPKLPPPKPPIARQHCRHYGYVSGLGRDAGPKCKAGEDNSGPGGSIPCLPDPTVACAIRQEWTADERAAWAAWAAEHRERMLVILTSIPRDGYQGEMQCPGCGIGTVRWSRARSNNHLHAGCSTPNCFGIMQ